ncbi:uncharacterized protein N7484_008247, partial [Penicillium longicatenatum]|uniref:uncharacterized protein n=1 Tax=Penicillium longicatenatum TaxID=1561947 RepID=UPI0025473FB2
PRRHNEEYKSNPQPQLTPLFSISNTPKYIQPQLVTYGRIPAIGKSISQHLLPKYKVIHFILSYKAIEAKLPHLLTGRDPQSQNPNKIRTHNYS